MHADVSYSGTTLSMICNGGQGDTWDGHVIDLYGLPWLIGFDDDANPDGQAVGAAGAERRLGIATHRLSGQLGTQWTESPPSTKIA
jgi:hypothetical protein